MRIREIHAELHDRAEEEGDEKAQLPMQMSLTGAEEAGEEFDVGLLLEIERFEIADNVVFELSLLLEGHFVRRPELDASERELEEFRKSEAFWELWPFVREAVHSITERMGLGLPPLPVLPRHVVRFGDEET